MFDVKRFDVMSGLLVVAAACSNAACSSPAPSEEVEAAPALGAGGTGALPSEPSGAAGVAEPSSSPAASPSMPVAEVPAPMDVVLDDFEDGDGALSLAGFSGSWRTYSDGTGTVTPAVDTPVIPVDGAVQVTGSGFATWGVGLSIDLDT